MVSQVQRRCACGTRLARDNRADACTACQKAASRRLSASPTVPAAFWDDPDLKAALADWHIGRVIRAYRLHPLHHQSIPQAVVAAWFDLTQAQLSRIENGPAVTDLARLIPMARALDIPDEFLWFKLARQEASVDAGRRSEPNLTSGHPNTDTQAQAKARSLSRLPVVEHGYATTMQSFRAADRQIGGGHLYAGAKLWPAVRGCPNSRPAYLLCRRAASPPSGDQKTARASWSRRNGRWAVSQASGAHHG